MPAGANNKAVRNLPKLLALTGSLVEFREKLLAEPIRYSEDDHLAFMGLLSVSQQLQFLKSIRLLVENNLGASAGLIARAMLEGMYLFLWCAKDSPSRPLHWRAFSLVKDFRFMMHKRTKGKVVDPATEGKILDGLGKYGDALLSNKGREARKKGNQPLRDDYIKNWPSVSKKQMFEEVEGGLLYQEVYSNMSDLTLWDIASFAGRIRRGSQVVCFLEDSSRTESAIALAVGCQSLLQSLELFDSHLRLQKGQGISDLKQQYIATLQT